MKAITEFLGGDHGRCDTLFAQLETDVAHRDWQKAQTGFSEFREALEQHFAMEEKVLFLAFENAIGKSQGPTSVMRNEHKQMRSMVDLMQEALDRQDSTNFLGCSDTLNSMMQQHNMKEESILYLMADRILSGQQESIIEAMQDIRALT